MAARPHTAWRVSVPYRLARRALEGIMRIFMGGSWVRTWLLCALLLLPLFINPNPFGNAPEAVHDESTFLTGALSALKSHVPPGWDFQSGTFYAGPMTTLYWVSLVFVLGVVLVYTRGMTAAQGWLLSHTGELMHGLRLLNGAMIALTLALLIAFALRKRLPKAASRGILLTIGLLGCNSLFLTMAHTGKGWMLSILLEVLAGVLLICAEAKREAGEPMDPGTLARWFIIGWTIATMETVTSLVGMGLWFIYFLLLKHISWRDLWRQTLKLIPFFVLMLVLHLSFFWSGYQVMVKANGASVTNVSTSRFLLPDGRPDLVKQALWPLHILAESVPFGLLLLAFGLFRLDRARLDARRVRLVAIAIAHPVITYFLYFILWGFGMFPRYGLPFSIAIGFSAVLLLEFLSRSRIRVGAVLAIGAVLSLCVANIFWRGASEREVERYVTTRLDRPGSVIVDLTRPLNLPLNAKALSLLATDHPQPRRFTFFLEHPELSQRFVSFKGMNLKFHDHPISALDGLPSDDLWVISHRCDKVCDTDTCKTFNAQACEVQDAWLQEGTTWADILRSPHAGRSYTIEKVDAGTARAAWQQAIDPLRPSEAALRHGP